MKNKKLVLTIVGVATLLIAVVGATFAFFASSMDNGTKNITVGTATVSNVQLTNEMIGMSDILPGYESESHNITASATITGEFAVPYTCKISQSSESLVDLEYLVVAGSGMSSTVNNAWTSVPTSATTFLTGSLSQASLSQTSTIKFRLHETGANQTSGQSGVNSTVTVTCTLDGGGSLYYNNNSSANGTTTAPTDSDFTPIVYSFGGPSVATLGYGNSPYAEELGGVIGTALPQQKVIYHSAEALIADMYSVYSSYTNSYSGTSELPEGVALYEKYLIDTNNVVQEAYLELYLSESAAETYGVTSGYHTFRVGVDESESQTKTYYNANQSLATSLNNVFNEVLSFNEDGTFEFDVTLGTLSVRCKYRRDNESLDGLSCAALVG